MTANATQSAQNTWKVLLVEDNPADRFLIQEAFRESEIPCDWRVIASGAEAMRIGNSGREAFQPDLILLDWQLPGATGLEVLTSLKESLEWASTPVIMFTGLRSSWHVKTARQAGACGVLEKPMDMDDWLKIPNEVKIALALAV